VDDADDDDDAEKEEAEPDDASGSRKVVVGKLACNTAMAIQLFLVVLSNFATGRFNFLNGLARKSIVFA
jgi:hypothetical protein